MRRTRQWIEETYAFSLGYPVRENRHSEVDGPEDEVDTIRDGNEHHWRGLGNGEIVDPMSKRSQSNIISSETICRDLRGIDPSCR